VRGGEAQSPTTRQNSIERIDLFSAVEGTLLAWHGSHSIPGHNFDEAKDTIIEFEDHGMLRACSRPR
jgi:hypothetical protein